jgi:hypothetical protein
MRQVVRHKIKYTAETVSLADVIDSLQAQQRLLQEGVAVLARAAPDSDLRIVAIRVNNIVASSMLIDLGIELYHAYQTSIDDKVIKGIEGLTGTDVPAEYEALVTLAALGVTYFVARWAYDKVFNRKKKEQPKLAPAPSIHIDGDYNRVVTIIADRLNLDPSAIDRAFEDEITPKKRRQLVGRVTDFLRPAKAEPGSSIEVEGLGEIAPETIAEYPNEADLAGLEDTTILDLPGAFIEIRATDRDSLKTGWKAKILWNENFPTRLPMDLYPTVDADSLADHKVVKADLAIEFARERGGTLRPKRIHLINFYPDDKPPDAAQAD